MLYHDKIDVSEGICISKTSASKETYIFRYYYSLVNRFKFQTDVSNGYYEVLMMFIKLKNITFLNI